MQLLTPEIGWALSVSNGSLFWTEDKGLTWKEITPSRSLFSFQRILSVFFLDIKEGLGSICRCSFLHYRRGRALVDNQARHFAPPGDAMGQWNHWTNLFRGFYQWLG